MWILIAYFAFDKIRFTYLHPIASLLIIMLFVSTVLIYHLGYLDSIIYQVKVYTSKFFSIVANFLIKKHDKNKQEIPQVVQRNSTKLNSASNRPKNLKLSRTTSTIVDPKNKNSTPIAEMRRRKFSKTKIGRASCRERV